MGLSVGSRRHFSLRWVARLGRRRFFPAEATQYKPAIQISEHSLLPKRHGDDDRRVGSRRAGGGLRLVVPVPAKPTKIEPSTSGALTTLQTLLAPEIDAQRSLSTSL